MVACAALRPAPVDAAVQHVDQLAKLDLGRRVGVEVNARGQCAGDEQRGIDRRKLRAPDTGAGAQVQEVVVEAPVAGRLGTAALIAVVEEAQHGETARDRFGARHPTALHGSGIARQCEARHRDARGRILPRGVGDETVRRIHSLHKVVERGALKSIQQQIVRQRVLGRGRLIG